MKTFANFYSNRSSKTNYVILSLYYVVSKYTENNLLKTENFGEIFFEVANNLFANLFQSIF